MYIVNLGSRDSGNSVAYRPRTSLRTSLPLLKVMVICSLLVALQVTALLITPTLANIWAQEQGSHNKERLAVLMLRNRINMSREETEYLTGLVRRIASKRLAQDYLIMTQENIDVLLPPDTNLEECVSECQVETGRTIGARYIITGEVLRFGKSLRLTLRMHDTKTGQLVSSEVAKSNTIEGLESPAEESVRSLIVQIQTTQDLKKSPPIDKNTSLPSPAEQPKEEVIIVGSRSSDYQESHLSAETDLAEGSEFRSRRMSRRERLEEQAQRAHREREARLRGDRLNRKHERARKQRARKQRARKQKARKQRVREQRAREQRAREQRAREQRAREQRAESQGGLPVLQGEMYFGLGTGRCEIEGVDCEESEIEHDVSLQMGLRYRFSDLTSAQRWGWKSGIELKYTHSSFSSAFDASLELPNVGYTMNALTLGYLFGYEANRLVLDAVIGLGLISGSLNNTQYYSNSDFRNGRIYL